MWLHQNHHGHSSNIEEENFDDENNNNKNSNQNDDNQKEGAITMPKETSPYQHHHQSSSKPVPQQQQQEQQKPYPGCNCDFVKCVLPSILIVFVVLNIVFELIICIVPDTSSASTGSGLINVFNTQTFANYHANTADTFTTRISAFHLMNKFDANTDGFYKIRNTFDESKTGFPDYLKWDSDSTVAVSRDDLANFSTNNFFNVTENVRNARFSWICIKSLQRLNYILNIRFAGIVVRITGEASAVLCIIGLIVAESIGIKNFSRPVAAATALAGLVTLCGVIVEFVSTGLLDAFIGKSYCTSNSAMNRELWSQNFLFLGASIMSMFSGLIFLVASLVILLNTVRTC